MTLAIGLALAGALLAFVPVQRHRPGVAGGTAVLALAVAHDVSPLVSLDGLARLVGRLPLVRLVDGDPTALALLLGALLWCGPAADLVVRATLEATRLPAPEVAADAGFGAGRWIGRLERWMIVVTVAAGQAGLAAIPIGGKALFRYAEVVADSRAQAPRVEPPAPPNGRPRRDALVEYVIVGSLASWAQAIVLGLLAAAA